MTLVGEKRGRPLSSIAYWAATVLVAAELGVGGVWDILRIAYARGMVEHLGYPSYLLVVMGVWKAPGAVALLIPRFFRLKKWIYAGAAFNFMAAAGAHLAAGDGIGMLAAPTIFTGLVAVSWILRPPAHRSLAPGLGPRRRTSPAGCRPSPACGCARRLPRRTSLTNC